MNKHIFFAALSLLAFTACNKEMKFQESWITNELEARVYSTKSAETVQTETQRVIDYCLERANNSLGKFSQNANENIRKTEARANLFGLNDLYRMMGTSAGEEERKNAQATMNRYKSKSENTIDRLREEIDKILLRENTGMMGQDSFSDEEIFYGLFGTPAKPAKPSDMEIQMYAETIAGFALLNMGKPTITNISYDKSKECWYVRMDNYDDQYVRFTKRNDGDYDINYGSTVGASGYPEGEMLTISANYRPTTIKETNEKEDDHESTDNIVQYDDGHAITNPKPEVFIGLWETEEKDSKINITSTYIQEWRDPKKLAEEGCTASAQEYKGKTVFDCTRQQWYLEGGVLKVTDGEYLYDDFVIDKSKEFIYRTNEYERKFYKSK